MRYPLKLDRRLTVNWWVLSALALFGISVAPAPAQIYVGSAFTHNVGKYDTASGVAINANFITGIGSADGLLLSGNTLFIADDGNQVVSEYDATTGLAINPNFISGIGGGGPLTVAGDKLFVTSTDVGEYNATTGAPINPNFLGITANIYGLALSMDNSALFVATAGGTIGKYNANTGAAINPSFLTIDGAWGLGVRGNILYVVNFSRGKISKYDAVTGSPIDSSFITGLLHPTNLAFRGNNLFVVSSGDNSTGNVGYVSKYDANTGDLIKAKLISGITLPVSIVVTPPGTPTPSPTANPTPTPSPTPTASPTATPDVTPTPTPDVTPTPTPAESPTPSPTVSPTPSPLPKTATPVILPIPGAYTKSVAVKITCATKGATIYYAIDLGVPTTSSPVYPKGKRKRVKIVGQGFHTIDAMAIAPGYDQSAIAETTYRIK